MKFSRDVLKINEQEEIEKITTTIRTQVFSELHRKGAVLGLSGGIDSSVCAALCVKALGAENVFAILMPEKDSSQESIELGKLVADSLNINYEINDITNLLQASGCYKFQVEAIREIIPEYGEDWKCKVIIPSILDKDRLNIFHITVQSPDGKMQTRRFTPTSYLKLIAATNWKQRIRKCIEYYHADRLYYAVCGTPNSLEYDQGFFVKNGDGSADFKPIAHLYKSQVYMLAKALGLPEKIIHRPPTTDTFSLAQTQEEFFFAVSYEKMDLCLYAYNHNIEPKFVASEINLTEEQVKRIYKDIESKRKATRYLHMKPLLVEKILNPEL